MSNYNSYYIDGDLYISVSTILGVEGAPALVPWALKKFGPEESPLKAYNEFMESVSNTGTRIHAFIEHMLKQNIKEAEKLISDDTAGALNAFLDWKKDHKVEMLLSEHRCYSKKWRVAGTCDLVINLDGKLYIADIKTGSVQPKAFTQMAAYKQFLLEDANLKIDGLDKAELAVLNVHRDGNEVKFITHDDFYGGFMTEKDELGLFHALRYIWAKRNLKAKKWSPVIKNMEDLISPLEKQFRKTFKL